MGLWGGDAALPFSDDAARCSALLTSGDVSNHTGESTTEEPRDRLVGTALDMALLPRVAVKRPMHKNEVASA